MAIKSGDGIKPAQENLEHATASITLDIYGHVTAQMKRNSASRMKRLLRSISAG